MMETIEMKKAVETEKAVAPTPVLFPKNPMDGGAR